MDRLVWRAYGGARAAGYLIDITDAAAVVRAFAQASAALGPVDILIHCAAISDNKTFMDSNGEDWRRQYRIAPAPGRGGGGVPWAGALRRVASQDTAALSNGALGGSG
ncbi:MAG: SDR family oxidoreductase [Gammaproteobacteria bacterium]|nr:SDR family oxidoreductase [Gammaproteobacteria bacterium]